MRREVFEETIRFELERQAEEYGVDYVNLPANAKLWLRSLVIEQLYNKDASAVVSNEVPDEE